MVKVGLSEQEIYQLLSDELTGWQTASEERLKNVIVRAIARNNEKVAEDVKKVIAGFFQTI
jgi:hypothetical protein